MEQLPISIATGGTPGSKVCMTYLQHTSSILAANSPFSHSAHNGLTVALDELLSARCNGKSWTIYNNTPFPMGSKQFAFGTITTTQGGYFYNYYNIADETPSAPIGGQILRWDVAGKIVWTVGYGNGGSTLNIQTVSATKPGDASPSTWYIGFAATSNCERFEKYQVADIGIENYTDPVAHNKTTFTYRSHWNKYGSIRVHNMNKFALTLNFEGTTMTYTIPALGVYTFRRLTNTSPADWDPTPTYFFPPTAGGDPAWFQCIQQDILGGNLISVGNMQTLYECWSTVKPFCLVSGSVDSDSTNREKDGFTGLAPVGTDKVIDWLYHRGDLWSVVMDRRTGEFTRTALTWNGLGTTWTDVTVTDNGSSLTFTSNVTPPNGAGPGEWSHDLIPISTNITDGTILSLADGPRTVYFPLISSCDLVGQSTNYSPAYRQFGITKTTKTAYRPWDLVSSFNYNELDTVDSNPPSIDTTTTLASYFSQPSTISGTSRTVNSYKKSSDKLVRETRLDMDLTFFGMSKFSDRLLSYVIADEANKFKWQIGQGVYISPAGSQYPLRFPWWRNRQFNLATDDDFDSVGNVYIQHPETVDATGSATLGKQWSIVTEPIYGNDIRIQGVAYGQQSPLYPGPNIFRSGDTLNAIVANIFTTGWWNANRERLIDNDVNLLTADERKVILRIPRLIEHFNDLALAVNSVVAVTPATIQDLRIDPFPADNFKSYPFTETYKLNGVYVTENGDSVPAEWAWGKYDADNTLKNWCNRWGVTYQNTLPDIADLLNVDRMMAYWPVNDGQLTIAHISVYDPAAYTQALSVAGQSYPRHKAMTPNKSRRLFGGAGPNSNYRWIKESDFATVIGGLGLLYPTTPIGERYDPTIHVYTTATRIAGRNDVKSTVSPTDAQMEGTLAYRKPNPAGTWLRVIPSNTQFRICESVGTAKKRLYLTQEMTGSPSDSQWWIFELDDDADSINGVYYIDDNNIPEQGIYVDLSDTQEINPRGLIPKSSTGDELWKSYTQITDNSGEAILLVFTQEKEYTYDWPSTPSAPISSFTIHPTYTSHTTDGASRIYYRILTASDFPVTKSKLNTWSGTSNNCWNCQWQRLSSIIR